MDNAFLMGVLDGLADGHEELEALLGRQAIGVAILGDGHSLDQLHDEERPAAVGGAGVENLGDVVVVHQGQGLALGLEPSDDLG